MALLSVGINAGIGHTPGSIGAENPHSISFEIIFVRTAHLIVSVSAIGD